MSGEDAVYIFRHEDVAPAEVRIQFGHLSVYGSEAWSENFMMAMNAIMYWSMLGPDKDQTDAELLRNIGSACASIEEMFEPLLSEDEAA